jgi:hypothetical protein
LILKNTQKAGIWTTFMITAFFFWGAFYDFIKDIELSPLLTSYSFLLSLLTALSLFLLFYLCKKNKPFNKTNSLLNIIFFSFILLEASISIYNIIINKTSINNYTYHTKVPTVKVNNSENIEKPDIFFIVLDEYASTVALEKFLHYDNKKVDSTLTSNNFYIAYNSQSNYNSTPHSISSALNLVYINDSLEGALFEPKPMLRAQAFLKTSLIPTFLQNHGYIIKNHSLCDLKNYPVQFEPLFNLEIGNIFTAETLWGRIKKQIWWNAVLFFRKHKLLDEATQKNNPLIPKIIASANNTLTELSKQDNTPKFVFTHIRIPHRPYFFNSAGKIREFTDKDITTFEDSLYIDQLKAVNLFIEQATSLSNKKFNRPRVVIIEGDHGKRSTYKKGVPMIREKQFMNLNAYYFSDGDYRQLYDSISPVNSFRVVLNKYFKTNLPLLKDSTILLH